MNRCPKCGGFNIVGPKYCDGVVGCDHGPCWMDKTTNRWVHLSLGKEHLIYTCAKCGYRERTDCFDLITEAKIKAEPKVKTEWSIKSPYVKCKECGHDNWTVDKEQQTVCDNCGAPVEI